MDVSEVICSLNQTKKKNLGYWVLQEIEIEYPGKNCIHLTM